MAFRGKAAVVTGGASGIGAAIAAGLETDGAKVCVLDLPEAVAGGPGIACDVSDETALCRAIDSAEVRIGPLDIFVSNAGVLSDQRGGAASASNADWARCWSVNVMAHVYAARRVVPAMIARGGGHFVIVASAAGLLNQIGDAAYSATKHAAVSFADSLAISHRHEGLSVSVVCPQYVATLLIGLSEADAAERDTLLTAQDVAEVTLAAMADGRFLVLPHPDVARFAQARALDHDGWIEGMIRLRNRAQDRFGDTRPDRFYRLL